MSISDDLASNKGATERLIDAMKSNNYDVDGGGIAPEFAIEGYSIISHIGSGGDADVYLAIHSRLSLEVAIKVYKHETLVGKRRERVDRECLILEEIAAGLDSIPDYRDHGWLDDGRMWVASDYIEGLSLDKHCKQNDLSLEQKVKLLCDLCKTVQSLHDRGVLHRDIKPSNVMVSEASDKIKLIDFGIASVINDDTMNTLTVPGAPIGSMAFMAPEQAEGRLRDITIKSDIYGLAATAYYILTGGETPHSMDGPAEDRLNRIINSEVRHPSEVMEGGILPRDLCRILLRGLNKNPEVRQPSAAHLADDFDDWIKGVPIAWAKPSAWQMIKYWVKQNPPAAIVTGIAVVAVIVAIMFGITSSSNARYAAEMADIAEQKDKLALKLGKLQSDLKGILKQFIPEAENQIVEGHLVETYENIQLLENLVTEINTTGLFDEGDERLRQYRYNVVMGALESVYQVDKYDRKKQLEEAGKIIKQIDSSDN